MLRQFLIGYEYVPEVSRLVLKKFSNGWKSIYWVALLSLIVSGYYYFLASPRFATEVQFLVEEAGVQNDLSGLVSLGAISGSTRDSLIVKEFIESRTMAEKLDDEIDLKTHFQSSEVDVLSRLSRTATSEEYWQYYQKRISVYHDEMSDLILVEAQAFNPEYSMRLAKEIIKASEEFINNLGEKMVREQVGYAEVEVKRAHELMNEWQSKLLNFQQENRFFDPVQETGAMVNGINELQLQLIKAETRLKQLTAVMRENAPEVKAQKYLIESLNSQLSEERSKITSNPGNGIGRVNMDFQEISLSNSLATDLYKSSLVSLDKIRSQSLQKLKHLLIVEGPMLAEEAKYPRQLYSVVSWILAMLLVYFVINMLFAVIKEHRD